MKKIIISLLIYFCFLFTKQVNAQTSSDWYMAGANPQRTSWVAEEVRGDLRPEWYRPIEPYIPNQVQIIAANNTLYISTAKGLYALDAATGDQKWVYPTEMPLGHSPTIVNGVVYVGGFDHKLHAINAANGQGLWTYEADAGFDTNPLVINNTVYAGNRDGYMYAVYSNDHTNKGTLAWKYKTDGPIHFSAATNSNGSVIFFASDDNYAYALNSTTGMLIWKTPKLPSAGFHSWWPVVTDNIVIFSMTRPYRVGAPPQIGWIEWEDYARGEPGLNIGFGGTQGDRTRPILPALYDYFASKPYLKSYLVFNQENGQEAFVAPFLSYGSNHGSPRVPVAVDADGVLYTANNYSATRYDNGVAGWQVGADHIETKSTTALTWDEPLGYAIGGKVVYWNQCCDRQAGFYATDTGENKGLFSYNLGSLIPNYDRLTTGTDESNAVKVFGGQNGVYGYHGNQNPPIPYKGKVYLHRSNVILAFSATGGTNVKPMSTIPAIQNQPIAVSIDSLKQKLASEIQKIIGAGHLKPGFGIDGSAGHNRTTNGDNLSDYWHNPLDTILVLSRTYPYLSSSQQTQLATYLQNEMTNFSPCDYTHVGWIEGAGREAFDLPPEVMADIPHWPATMWSTYGFAGWTGPDWKWTPHTFYALWKYAQAFGGAKSLFDNCLGRMWTPPADNVLAEYPMSHNAWIAGLWGYLELEKLAGYPEETDKRNTLNRLLALRSSTFNKDNPWGGPDSNVGKQSLAVARNFIYMTPELGNYLRQNAFSKIQTAFAEYSHDAPYWFVTRYEATYSEGAFQHLYDYNGLFAARAWIFHDPREELVKYLDVPAFARGDLFYIQNLVAAIEAPASNAASPTPTTAPVHCSPLGDIDCSGKVTTIDLSALLSKFNTNDVKSDLDDSGVVNALDLFKLLQNFGK